jgi:hypothetical protein
MSGQPYRGNLLSWKLNRQKPLKRSSRVIANFCGHRHDG